jgi:DNA modification methylase
MNLEPEDFKKETTTVWSFPKRGDWATHNNKYRGNFAPQVARNLILRYSDESDTILDPMCGSGTSLIEAKLLNRNSIGIDINLDAVALSKVALDFTVENSSTHTVMCHDSRDLSSIPDDSIDLIIFHPPYHNIIKYSKGEIEADLSSISKLSVFLTELAKVGFELKRVLKSDKFCAVLIGDTRKNKHYIPISHFVLDEFLKMDFVLKEEIIKLQHNCTHSTRWNTIADKMGFYLIMHEHLFVFRKK